MKALSDSLKLIAGAAAVFATAFSFDAAPDADMFFSQYYAGVATGVALLLLAEDDD